MIEKIDLFQDQYRTLNYLLETVYKLNPTGGYYDNDTNKPIPPDYQIDFYKDLAFIVEFRNETDNNEKIIDNAIYLKQVGDGLYQIYEIDGKVLGRLNEENMRHTEMVIDLINSMIKKEIFKK